ncbi:MAG: hypothetical protein FWB77_04335 [Treponema sp.]|nr:hypothetical protein [Treponema sp.]
MKKFLFLFVIIALTVPVYSQDFRFILNAGSVGLGGNFPLKGDYDLEGSFSLINFGIEERNTNIGVEINPFKTFLWDNGYESEYLPLSLLNLHFYWNVLSYDFSISNIYFGPFASINYFFIEEEILWDRYIFSAGLQMGFRYSIGKFNYNIFSCELGYRLIDGSSRYYISAKVDLIVFLIMALYANVFYY